MGSSGRRSDILVAPEHEVFGKLYTQNGSQSLRRWHYNYLTMIGFKVESGANRGIQAFNQKLLEQSQCFSELAGEFYGELQTRKLKELWQAIEKPDLDFFQRPNLLSTTTDRGASPGWLWELANRFAQGDGNVAITLIGLCGHDDTMQFPSNFQFSNSEAQQRNQKHLSNLLSRGDFRDKANRFISEAKKKDPNFSYTSEALINDLRDVAQSVKCPSSLNAFYYPQSLGKGADIPRSLKEKIAKIQAPNKGAKVLPAKYYHLMAGAVTSCQLVQGGLPKFFSRPLVEHAANGYRAGRLCGERLTWMNPNGIPRELKVALPMAMKIKAAKGECEKTNFASPSVCQQIAQLFGGPTFWQDPDLTEEIIQKKLGRKLGEFDAAELFAKSPEFKDSNGCQGPQFTKGVYDFLVKNSSGAKNNPCPKDWSEDRCSNARKVITTYAVDFEWSMAQQMAGLDFADAHCHAYKRGTNLESSACAALQNLRAQGRRKSNGDASSGEFGFQ